MYYAITGTIIWMYLRSINLDPRIPAKYGKTIAQPPTNAPEIRGRSVLWEIEGTLDKELTSWKAPCMINEDNAFEASLSRISIRERLIIALTSQL